MLKRLGFVFFIFCGLATINYLISGLVSVLTSPFSASAASAASTISLPYLVPVSTPTGERGALTAVDFSLFGKNGKGWDYVTQGYGYTSLSYIYLNHWHNGIDIAAKFGAPIYSPADGIVIATGNQDDYCPDVAFGKYVAVEDDVNHVVLWFAHLNKISVGVLDNVKKGDLLATVGASGRETGTHLHFSVYRSAGFNMDPAHGCGPYPNGKDIDPVPVLTTVY